MKKNFIYSIFVFIVLFSVGCTKDDEETFTAQKISITKSTLDKTSIGSSVSFNYIENVDVPDLTSGENKTWDLKSNAVVTSTAQDTRYVNLQTSTNFKDADYFKNISYYIFGQPVLTHEYFYITDSKIYAKGFTVDAQTISTAGITVTIPAQEVIYSVPKIMYYFPITYDGTNYTIPQYSRTINATISGISSLGVPDGTPVGYVVTYTCSYKVISWGALQIYNNDNAISALLVQYKTNTVETIFVNGVKAPQSLLTNLGLTQDNSTSSTDYSFRNLSYIGSVADFGLNGNSLTYVDVINSIR